MGLYGLLHPKGAVLIVLIDHVRDPLTAFHPQLDQLSKHLKDSLARAHTLLLEDGWDDITETESGILLPPVPPPPLKVHSFRVRIKRLDFDGWVVRDV